MEFTSTVSKQVNLLPPRKIIAVFQQNESEASIPNHVAAFPAGVCKCVYPQMVDMVLLVHMRIYPSAGLHAATLDCNCK